MNSGKMSPHVLATDFLRALSEQRFIPLHIDPLHAIRSGLLPFHQRDPFDRLLIAQAISETMRLLTADPQLAAYSELVITV